MLDERQPVPAKSYIPVESPVPAASPVPEDSSPSSKLPSTKPNVRSPEDEAAQQGEVAAEVSKQYLIGQKPSSLS